MSAGQDSRDTLDALARALMATRPDLDAMSLDEWSIEHAARLSPNERRAAQAIVEMYTEREI